MDETEMSTEGNVHNHLITLSRPDSQVLPLKAVKGGKYVNVNAGKFIVELDGLLRFQNGPIFEGTIKESEIVFSRFIYIGTVYPDQACVPFIPIANVEIRKRKTTDYYGRPSEEEVGEVDMIIPTKAWEFLRPKLEGSFSAYIVETKGVETFPETYRVACKLGHEDVVRVCLNGMWFEKKIQDAFKETSSLHGNVFLMPKYTRTPASCTAELSFELYGMWLTEDIEKIFGPFHWQKVMI